MRGKKFLIWKVKSQSWFIHFCLMEIYEAFFYFQNNVHFLSTSLWLTPTRTPTYPIFYTSRVMCFSRDFPFILLLLFSPIYIFFILIKCCGSTGVETGLLQPCSLALKEWHNYRQMCCSLDHFRLFVIWLGVERSPSLISRTNHW